MCTWVPFISPCMNKNLETKMKHTCFYKTIQQKFLNNDFRKAWGQNYSIVNFNKNAHKFVHGLVTNAEL